MQRENRFIESAEGAGATVRSTGRGLEQSQHRSGSQQGEEGNASEEDGGGEEGEDEEDEEPKPRKESDLPADQFEIYRRAHIALWWVYGIFENPCPNPKQLQDAACREWREACKNLLIPHDDPRTDLLGKGQKQCLDMVLRKRSLHGTLLINYLQIVQRFGKNRSRCLTIIAKFVIDEYDLSLARHTEEEIESKVNFLIGPRLPFVIGRREGKDKGLWYYAAWIPSLLHELFLKPGMTWSADREGFIEKISFQTIALLFAMIEVVIRKHATGLYNSKVPVKQSNPLTGI